MLRFRNQDEVRIVRAIVAEFVLEPRRLASLEIERSRSLGPNTIEYGMWHLEIGDKKVKYYKR